MTDPGPKYTTTPSVSGLELSAETVQQYLEARRRALIMELRQIDKQLDRPQTIPERKRPR